ncbi:methyltransferase family protein [Sphaerotilus hippei]|uniref:Methyltransferase family protein n=1 Tax=Sphaerotilus hippei TaxID=744406 RepID=A0A318H466_9BURK|nr:class I SAM-dependent methyltransferase [Sphaerotilus hippei]PXW96636.1 methyltransferase family protein [Sphaerotilus hippei]
MTTTATAATDDRQAWSRLIDGASAPYRSAGRFAWHFARGKLGMDPVFRHLLARGLIPPGARVLDIGCGQGLLASLLRAVGPVAGQGGWPAGWAAAPTGCKVTGIELMASDVERARAALGVRSPDARFVCADMREADFPDCEAVVILDVLHYIDPAAQDRVLARVHAALRPGGLLLLRVGDAAAPRGFAISQWVDRVVTRVRGHRAPPTHGRPLGAWIDALRQLGFTVEPRPMSQGTPFANVLLVARRGAAAAGGAR